VFARSSDSYSPVGSDESIDPVGSAVPGADVSVARVAAFGAVVPAGDGGEGIWGESATVGAQFASRLVEFLAHNMPR
jgi:hypothetical protein